MKNTIMTVVLVTIILAISSCSNNNEAPHEKARRETQEFADNPPKNAKKYVKNEFTKTYFEQHVEEAVTAVEICKKYDRFINSLTKIFQKNCYNAREGIRYYNSKNYPPKEIKW
ncbi:MAG: hypothetical protein LBD61_02530 [Endomicrobium sp.]|nr:hypothetical protein [Endomicrobium sp.]